MACLLDFDLCCLIIAAGDLFHAPLGLVRVHIFFHQAPNDVIIVIAKKVFSPDPSEVAFAKRILEAMPDGSGVAMLDGKMQDDATWKQAKVMVDSAKLVAAKDPDMAAAYGF